MFTIVTKLTPKEIISLGDTERDEIKQLWLQAKEIIRINEQHNIPENEANMIVRVVKCANDTGELSFRLRRINRCNCCGHDAGYDKYSRSGKYHSKGDINTASPRTILGYDFEDRFIQIDKYIHVGMCEFCFTRLQPILREELQNVKARINEKITGQPSKYTKFKLMTCGVCGWVGKETEMRSVSRHRLDGCPKCDAVNKMFGLPVIKQLNNEFVVEPIQGILEACQLTD